MKTKRALVSMFIFLTVFSLTSIFHIQIPLFSTAGSDSQGDASSSGTKLTTEGSLVPESNGKITTIGQDQYLASKKTSLHYDASLAEEYGIQNPTAIMAAFGYDDNANEAATQEETTMERNEATSTSDTADASTDSNSPPITDSSVASNFSRNTNSSEAKDSALTSDTAETTDKENSEEVLALTETVEALPEPLYSNIGISVAKEYVNIRKEPSTDSGVLGKLYRDSAAEILSQEGDWYYVESGSVKGYAKAEYIKTGLSDDELITNFSIQNIRVEVDGLNVREEPSTEARKLTVVYQNETYPVIEITEEWIQIEIQDENLKGYVKKEMTDLIVDFKDAISKEEEQLILQLQAEERARQETAIKQRDSVSYTEQDLKLLACLVHSEAGTQSYEGKLAVANVVLNRMKSSKYPETMKAVIYQPGQFTVAKSGSLQKQLDNYHNYNSKSQKLSIKAAKDALEGANNIGSRLYFHSYKAAKKKGYDTKSNCVKLDDHLFW